VGKSTISTGPFSIANCNKLPEGSQDVFVAIKIFHFFKRFGMVWRLLQEQTRSFFTRTDGGIVADVIWSDLNSTHLMKKVQGCCPLQAFFTRTDDGTKSHNLVAGFNLPERRKTKILDKVFSFCLEGGN